MNNSPDNLIRILTPEIRKKCESIKLQKEQERMWKVFMGLCMAFLLIPTLFILFGFNLMTLLVPFVFTALSFLCLSPILIHQEGDSHYEQI